MERRANNMETITLRVRRAGAVEAQRLELCGHRLLGGHADTGIFRIAESETLRPPKRSRAARREDDDGLATATIEIDRPLALAEEPVHNNPYKRG
jgi:hypothetical protein